MDMRTTLQTLIRDGFILVFNQDKLDVVETARALIKAGINNMEVTCRIAGPLDKIKELRDQLPDFAVGAASLIDFPPILDICNEAHSNDPLPSVGAVVESDASYIVSAANFSNSTYHQFAGRLPIIPGCGTTTEILDQFSRGANLCKIFPAKQLGGPAFVKAIDPAVHKTISLIPTGGTDASNIPDYIAAGVLVLGGSFSMIEKTIMRHIIDDQDYDLLAEQFANAKQLIDAHRAKRWPDIDFANDDLDRITAVTGRNFNLR